MSQSPASLDLWQSRACFLRYEERGKELSVESEVVGG